MRGTALLVAALASLPVVASAQAPGPFPAGPGRDIVAKACVQCHTAKPITQLRMGEAAWRRQVQNMVLRGAQIGPDDLDPVAAYLGDKFGPGVPFPDAKPGPEIHLAAGPAQPLVEGGCALCHGLDRITDTKRPPGQWPAIVHRMVEFGAPLDADQTTQVIDYLKANYTPPPAS